MAGTALRAVPTFFDVPLRWRCRLSLAPQADPETRCSGEGTRLACRLGCLARALRLALGETPRAARETCALPGPAKPSAVARGWMGSSRSVRRPVLHARQPPGFSTRSTAGGLLAHFSLARVGRGNSTPPQFGHRPSNLSVAHGAQKVHSKEQMNAAAESAGRSRSQHSQLGRISSMASDTRRGRAGKAIFSLCRRFRGDGVFS